MDEIVIRRLRVKSHLGVSDEERARPQFVVLDVRVTADLRPAGRSDELADTIDYGRLTEEIAGLVRSSKTRLLEAMAERVAQMVLDLPGATRVSVELSKEAPPIGEEVDSVGVRIERP
jgi:FolB domain-containing protein